MDSRSTSDMLGRTQVPGRHEELFFNRSARGACMSAFVSMYPSLPLLHFVSLVTVRPISDIYIYTYLIIGPRVSIRISFYLQAQEVRGENSNTRRRRSNVYMFQVWPGCALVGSIITPADNGRSRLL